jgi:hypothetical protein
VSYPQPLCPRCRGLWSLEQHRCTACSITAEELLIRDRAEERVKAEAVFDWIMGTDAV